MFSITHRSECANNSSVNGRKVAIVPCVTEQMVPRKQNGSTVELQTEQKLGPRAATDACVKVKSTNIRITYSSMQANVERNIAEIVATKTQRWKQQVCTTLVPKLSPYWLPVSA